MNVAVLDKRPAQRTDLAVVDCDIHPAVRSMADLYRYMAPEWVALHQSFGAASFQTYAKRGSYARYNRDGGSRFDTRPPDGGPSGSDVAFLGQHHLDANNIEIGILQAMQPQVISSRNQGLGAAMTAAVNDWQRHDWCAREPRLRGSIMLTREDPAAALRELARWAGDPHFVQASTMPHGIEPLGRQRYWPILEAVEASGLPLGIHVGGASAMAPTSSGWPSFYIEEHHAKCEAMQALMVSLVVEGVFERFPRLKIVLIEGGFVWVPSMAWRLDRNYKRLKAETPHLERLPSEYIRDHFWYTTQPIEEPEDPQDLADVMEWVGWDKILFSTDYPHWDFDDPRFAFKVRLSEEHRRMIFRDNARALFRLA